MGTTWNESGGGLLAPEEPRLQRRRVVVPSSCPPFDLPPFDHDGDGGGGGGGRGDGPPPGGDDERGGTAELGLGLALLGIGTLFSIFLLAWVLMRRSVPEWPTNVHSPAPEILWLGTTLLLASSLALHTAFDRPGQPTLAEARRALSLALGLGGGFLVAQTFLWRSLGTQGFLPSSGGPGTIFYALTGLHAAHVLVGLVALGALYLRCLRGACPTRRRLRLGAVYWHAMGALWIVLFVTLYLAR